MLTTRVRRGNVCAGRALLRAFPAILLAGFLLAGCPPRIVRIPVPPEDIIRANQAIKDADLSFTRKDYYAALIKYLEAARLNPNSEFIYNKLGIAYSQLRFYSEAAGAFQRCIGLNPKFAYGLNNLGSVYFAQHELKKAEKNFKRAIRLNPNAASFHVNLGTLYMEKKKFDMAMAEWKKGLALDPTVLSKADNVNLAANGRSPVERYYFLARLYASFGDLEHAIENLQNALTAGFTDIAAIELEKDFDRIRSEEKFVDFMKNTAALLTTPK
jgi:tetratricopeptide (TPR) repeat protein